MTTISIAEFTQLKKLMDMSQSSNEGEQLNAIRLANRILEKHKLSWTEILSRTVTLDVEAAPYEPSNEPRAEKQERTARDKIIDGWFATLREGHTWSNFVDSLYDQWQKRNWLSKPQIDALERTVERAGRK